MRIFLVGGAVRDKMMGKTPKDFDYTVVLDNGDHCDLAEMNRGVNGTRLIGPKIDFFTFMGHKLRKQGFKVFVMTPEHLTIRAHFPKGHVNAKLTADFVMARKEGEYSDGRRPDSVEPGTLFDDLARRDFTMNAIAEAEDGAIIDPFNGRQHILDGIIVPVGDGKKRLMEDALRALRAIRFMVQLEFILSRGLRDALNDSEVVSALAHNISDERKMDELNKMFRVDPFRSIQVLNAFEGLAAAVFQLDGKVNLMATMKQKGFNK